MPHSKHCTKEFQRQKDRDSKKSNVQRVLCNPDDLYGDEIWNFTPSKSEIIDFESSMFDMSITKQGYCPHKKVVLRHQNCWKCYGFF
jgi:hypothetical protein